MNAGPKSMALSPIRRRFIEEYLIDLDAAAACRRAGYKTKQPGVVGYQLLQNTTISSAINSALEARSKRTEITADRVLVESGRLAFLDIRKLYDDEGNLKPVSQWDDETAAAVAGIESLQQYEYIEGEKVPAGVLKKIRLWDKPSQLTLLAKHLKLLQEEKNETVLNIQVTVTTPLTEALHRAYSDVSLAG